MPTELISLLGNLGTAGIFLYLWWQERSDRKAAQLALDTVRGQRDVAIANERAATAKALADRVADAQAFAEKQLSEQKLNRIALESDAAAIRDQTAIGESLAERMDRLEARQDSLYKEVVTRLPAARGGRG